MFKQTFTHLLWVGAFLVDLVDRNNHRHIGCLGMLNGFDRLRHKAVVSCNHQNDDIGNRRTALAHLRKRFMARGIEEGDERAILCLHLIRADVLRNTASFTRNDICAAQGVKQRCLTMVDMAHDRHDRRTRLQRFWGINIFVMNDVNVSVGNAGDVVAKLFDEQFRRILVDCLVDRDGHAHFEQCLDQVTALFCHTVGQFLNGNCFRNNDVTGLLDLSLTAATAMQTLFFFTRTLQRGE